MSEGKTISVGFEFYLDGKENDKVRLVRLSKKRVAVVSIDKPEEYMMEERPFSSVEDPIRVTRKDLAYLLGPFFEIEESTTLDGKSLSAVFRPDPDLTDEPIPEEISQHGRTCRLVK